METSIKEIGKMGKDLDRVFMNTQMETFTKENGNPI
jgi:hypothetical protein